MDRYSSWMIQQLTGIYRGQLGNESYSMLVLKSLGQILCICQSLQVRSSYACFSCDHILSHSQSKLATALPERQLSNKSMLLHGGCTIPLAAECRHAGWVLETLT